MALLGGGVIFLEYFHEFLGLEHKKIFGKTLGQSRCFGIIIGRFGQVSGHFVTLGNSKNVGFSVFLGKFGNFFFQNTIVG